MLQGIGYLGSVGNPTRPNGPMFAHTSVLDVVAASAAEAEYGAVFTVGQQAVWCRTILNALGHIQPPTVIYTDNECAVGLASDSVKIRRSRTIDNRFHWVRDRVRQGQFIVKWISGANILADFFTKPLAVHRHQTLMHHIVYVPIASCNHFTTYKARRWNNARIKHSIANL